MVLRDRSHPSIVIWGVRLNESANDPELYPATTKEAKRHDPSRPTSGSMTRRSTAGWQQDVFAFDDYHAEPDGSVSIAEASGGVGAIWIRTQPGSAGRIVVTATHSALGLKSVAVRVR